MPSRLQQLQAISTELGAMKTAAEGVEQTLGRLGGSDAGGAIEKARGAVVSGTEALGKHLHAAQLTLDDGAKKLLNSSGDLLQGIVQMVGTLSQVAGTGGGITPSGAAAGLAPFGGSGTTSPTGSNNTGGPFGPGSGVLTPAPPPPGSGNAGGSPFTSAPPSGNAGGDLRTPGSGNAGADLNVLGAALPPLPQLFDAIRAGVLDFGAFLSYAATQRIPSAVNAIADAVSRLDPRAYQQKLFEITKALDLGQLKIEEVLKFLDETNNETAKYFANLIKQFREGNLSLEVLRQQLDQLSTSTLKGTTFEDLIKELADQALQEGHR